MTAKIGLLLNLLLTLLTGVCPQRPRDVNVKAGEMVALYCRPDRRNNHGDAGVIWRSYTTQEMNLTAMSSAEQAQMGLLVHGRSLVILSASIKHQGNYSCSQGDAGSQSWFRLRVYTTQREGEEMSQYPGTCYTQEACTLYCPDVNVPAEGILNITSNSIIWRKVGESLPIDGYFSRVEEKDQGAYTCTRSYLYNGQIYNRTFTVLLDIKPKEKSGTPVILSPLGGDVFHVDLGSTKLIDCEGVMYSDFDGMFWYSGESIVETKNSYPVFYNTTREKNAGEIKMTASLIFNKVSEVDLSKNYTCKLASVSGHSSSVTITLAQKTPPSSFSLALSILCAVVVVVIIVAVVVIVKLSGSKIWPAAHHPCRLCGAADPLDPSLSHN
ncbi:interleukin-1 receptor type 2-like [Epinephelus lanceolatus]|uniref:interleukin-1 receptor type 2-like n=1 Tax=Epinephelus lanceolatus TaxID=310571 RepID=UPI00144625AC|nr:interleukin-1 receptor type 2-like [Epinephelus lanceolatus]